MFSALTHYFFIIKINKTFLCHGTFKLYCTPLYHVALRCTTLYYTVSELGQEEGCTVKYTPPPEGVPKGKARGNS